MSRYFRNGYRYVFSEDWFIYATDDKNRLHCVNTEMWPDWLGFPEKKQNKLNAVRKCMLPIALKKEKLHWYDAKFEGKWLTFSFIEHCKNKLMCYCFYRPKF